MSTIITLFPAASSRRRQQVLLIGIIIVAKVIAFSPPPPHLLVHHANNNNNNNNAIEIRHTVAVVQASSSCSDINDSSNDSNNNATKRVIIIGAGWGGLSTAHALMKSSSQKRQSNGTAAPPGPLLDITVIDAAHSVGGLVRDGYPTLRGKIDKAEAGQHGFWDNYNNIFHLLDKDLPNDVVNINDVLTGYAEQGQYSPNGLEAVWPVYRNQIPALPTGLAQAMYTKFTNLSPLDRLSAVPLVMAFSEFDDSQAAWEKYDRISFRELCIKLGVSKKCYQEAFEPMILTGLFAPGSECSAAAALGMAYFFVLKSQNSFDVRWCRGNIGERIFQPWVQYMRSGGRSRSSGDQPVKFMTSTRVIGFETAGGNNDDIISKVTCQTITESGKSEEFSMEADAVVFAVGGAALNAMVRNSPSVLARHEEFRNFANLRGTGVLATRLYLDRYVDTPYSANACWGFDPNVGMTFFDITKLHHHGIHHPHPTSSSADNNSEEEEEGNNGSGSFSVGSIIEVDYYHAASLLVMSDEAIVEKVKRDLNTILGSQCQRASVVDAAVVRLPQAVNWYSPGSYSNMPSVQSSSLSNVYFAGDIVKTRHGSWSQEKAYVTGLEAANAIMKRNLNHSIIPLEPDEPHVALGRRAVRSFQSMLLLGRRLGGENNNKDLSDAPSLVDFLW